MTEPSTTGRLSLRRRALRAHAAAESAGYCHCTRCQRRTGAAARPRPVSTGRRSACSRARSSSRPGAIPTAASRSASAASAARTSSAATRTTRPDERPPRRVRRRSRRAADLARVRRLRGAVGADPRRRARALPGELGRASGSGCVGSAGVSAGWRSKRPGVTRCGAGTSVSWKPAASRTARSRRRAAGDGTLDSSGTPGRRRRHGRQGSWGRPWASGSSRAPRSQGEVVGETAGGRKVGAALSPATDPRPAGVQAPRWDGPGRLKAHRASWGFHVNQFEHSKKPMSPVINVERPLYNRRFLYISCII